MRKKLYIIGVIIAILILLLMGVLFFNVLKPRGARLLIETTPSATVVINGEQLGKTTFEKDLQAGEVTVKLIPDLGEKPLVTFEAKVTLEPGIKTVIHHSFAESQERSAGEIVSFEKIGGKDAEVSVISTPDGGNVRFDTQARGATPLKISEVKPGVHQLSVSATGYSERSFPVQAVAGYRLIAAVKLALTGDTLPQPTAAPIQSDKKPLAPQEVEILQTPTGFLRVRSEPLTSASEVGRATPGKKYPFLEKDEKSGWLKIQFSESVTGWVSPEYATASAKPSN